MCVPHLPLARQATTTRDTNPLATHPCDLCARGVCVSAVAVCGNDDVCLIQRPPPEPTIADTVENSVCFKRPLRSSGFGVFACWPRARTRTAPLGKCGWMLIHGMSRHRPDVAMWSCAGLGARPGQLWRPFRPPHRRVCVRARVCVGGFALPAPCGHTNPLSPPSPSVGERGEEKEGASTARRPQQAPAGWVLQVCWVAPAPSLSHPQHKNTRPLKSLWHPTLSPRSHTALCPAPPGAGRACVCGRAGAVCPRSLARSCFWCGVDTGGLAVLGTTPGGMPLRPRFCENRGW